MEVDGKGRGLVWMAGRVEGLGERGRRDNGPRVWGGGEMGAELLGRKEGCGMDTSGTGDVSNGYRWQSELGTGICE